MELSAGTELRLSGPWSVDFDALKTFGIVVSVVCTVDSNLMDTLFVFLLRDEVASEQQIVQQIE